MFKHLLIPLDGTRLAEAVLPLGAFLAEKAGAKVTLLHVVERAAPAAVHGDAHLTSAEAAEAYLQEVAARAFPPGVTVERHVHGRQIADVAHSLADHAEEMEPDLILMVTHGRPRLMQRLFGTIPQKVIRQTATPVLLVHPGPNGEAPGPFQQILVPLDGQSEHEAGLAMAAKVAQLCQAPVRLLMVVPTRGLLAGAQAATGQLLPAATSELLDLAIESGVEYLRGHVEALQQQGVSASGAVARGNPQTVVDQTARDCHADLVVLGTHGTAGTEAFWAGSLSAKLIGQLPASFLLAPAHG